MIAQKMSLIDVSANLNQSSEVLVKNQIDIDKIYRNSAYWPRTFYSYEPIHLKKHFYTFFNCNTIKIIVWKGFVCFVE